MRPMHVTAAACAALLSTAAVEAQEIRARVERTAEWSYSGLTGPEHWARLDTAYRACGAGQGQSPVDLSPTIPNGTYSLRSTYSPWNSTGLRNTHLSVHIEGRLPGAMVDSGFVYDLIGVHWHVPSEHTVSGRRFPAEVHAVHRRQVDGALMVLGTLVDEGAHAPAWDPIIRVLPGNDDQTAPLPGSVDLNALLGIALQVRADWVYAYTGSLTTPPCSPGVKWVVRRMPIYLSREQLDALARATPRNARPIQPAFANLRLYHGHNNPSAPPAQ